MFHLEHVQVFRCDNCLRSMDITQMLYIDIFTKKKVILFTFYWAAEYELINAIHCFLPIWKIKIMTTCLQYISAR